MALLSLEMIREIRGVADAYTVRERERLGMPAVNPDRRDGQPRRREDDDSKR